MIQPRAAAIAGAVTYGGLCLLVGLANLIVPDYGVAFLAVLDSIYFGLVSDGTVGSVIALTSLAVVDGAILGFVAAWVYGRVASTA